ncbi:molybdenum cofactor biosynthesis protein MoaE [Balneatrix alpica]|uniref:Molybdopterin synthase catalytic subunit n=1 Tax=Balneatrix alpica TaxID=75684 RepID=A0ABV5ZD97_9GAMM|nr:molybdenum cofactor biosynthesis protein MoaE [Balneatrix alpica]
MEPVQVTFAPLDPQALCAPLYGNPKTGAVVSFSGLVRDFNERPEVSTLTLEHYPGMTEKVLEKIRQQALTRWPLQQVIIAHRVGPMQPTEVIVVVAVAASHRADAFAACAYVMDILKTQAPFWKKEDTDQGSYWVDARESDTEAAKRWMKHD